MADYKYANKDQDRYLKAVAPRDKVHYIEEGETYITWKSEWIMKWFAIPIIYLEKARAIASSKKVLDKWISWSGAKDNKGINKYGIGTQYTTSARMMLSNLSQGEIIFFTYCGEEGKPSIDSANYVLVGNKPSITATFFYPTYNKSPGAKKSSEVQSYLFSVPLYIDTHMIPDYSLDYHNFASFEVRIFDMDSDKEMTSEPLKYFQKTLQNEYAVDTPNVLNIFLNPKWKKKSNHKKGKVKTYYAKIKTTIYSNDQAQAGHTSDTDGRLQSSNFRTGYVNHFLYTAPNGQEITVLYTEKNQTKSNKLPLGDTDHSRGKADASKYSKKVFKVNGKEWYSTKSQNQGIGTFRVKYKEASVELEEFETDKTNKIAVIGDVDYSSKSNEPCKFSQIEITKGKDKPIIIFDENKPMKDNTDNPIALISGSRKSKIRIKAKGLQTTFHKNGAKHIKCEGKTMITTRKKNQLPIFTKQEHGETNDLAFKHDSINKVFNTQYAYALIPNISSYYKSDSSGKLDITSQGIDISNTGSDYIDIKLAYIYNKTINSKFKKWVEEHISKEASISADELWVTNYFSLKEDLAQTYFIPVATCRYPSQMVLFKVYPKAIWMVSFSLGKIAKKHKESWAKGLKNYRREQYAEDPIVKYLDNKNKNKKKNKALKKLNLSLSFRVKCDNKKISFSTSLGQKIHDLVYKFIKAKEWMDKLTGGGEGAPSISEKKDFYKKALTKKSKALSKFTELPISINIYNPAFSVGCIWSFEYQNDDNITALPTYDIFFKAAPLIKAKGTLDLLALSERIPVFGEAIFIVDIILELAGVESSFYISASGQINLSLNARIQSGEEINIGSGDIGLDGNFKIRVEASITTTGKLGFLFAGLTAGANNVKAYAETGLTGGMKFGADNQGPYIDYKLLFTGLTCVMEKSLKHSKLGTHKRKKLGNITVMKKKVLAEGKTHFGT